MTLHRATLLLGAVLPLVACASPPVPAQSPSPEPGVVRMAAVGDSITAADSADLAAGDLGQESWVWHAVGPDITFVGGWAVWGATTAQMAAGVAELDAEVLVVLAGTNDAAVPFTETAENLRTVVTRAGVEQVVLSAVPPVDSDPGRAVELNSSLRALAEQEGWGWSPQAPGLADDGGRFAPGTATDGLHPSREGAALIGEQIAAAVRAAAD